MTRLLLFLTLTTLLNAAPKAPEGMVWIDGATYTRGTEKNENLPFNPEERPVHPVTVSGFFIDIDEVTNAQFRKFTQATGFKTQAERGFSAQDFPKAPPEALKPGALIFSGPPESVNLTRPGAEWQWWRFVPGASWKNPTGPDSDLQGKDHYPAVCLTYEDASAYATWAKKRLPTEAEWELAARGGHEKRDFIWGSQAQPDGKYLANVFTGKFPENDTGADGFTGIAPIKSYPPNDFGLYDMAGNVWEICSDFYRPDYYETFLKNPHPNPTGPKTGVSQPEISYFYRSGQWPAPEIFGKPHPLSQVRVMRGGSFLCHTSYCLRYRPGARHFTESLAPTNHTGFRCVQSADERTEKAKNLAD